jgi:peroxiredoxin Q/BCP
MGPEVGQPAPQFTLPGISAAGDGTYRLAAERGHPVVLAFYPGDETPVCTRQLGCYQDDLDLIVGGGATLWAISRQDLDSHRRFAAHRGLTFPLLSDVSGEVCAAYGVAGRLMTRRAVFVVGPDGALFWKHVSRLGLRFQAAETIAEVLRRLSTAYPAAPSRPAASAVTED